MPNWCTNEVNIYGHKNEEQLKQFVNECVTHNVIDFVKVMPYPDSAPSRDDLTPDSTMEEQLNHRQDDDERRHHAGQERSRRGEFLGAVYERDRAGDGQQHRNISNLDHRAQDRRLSSAGTGARCAGNPGFVGLRALRHCALTRNLLLAGTPEEVGGGDGC